MRRAPDRQAQIPYLLSFWTTRSLCLPDRPTRRTHHPQLFGHCRFLPWFRIQFTSIHCVVVRARVDLKAPHRFYITIALPG